MLLRVVYALLNRGTPRGIGTGIGAGISDHISEAMLAQTRGVDHQYVPFDNSSNDRLHATAAANIMPSGVLYHVHVFTIVFRDLLEYTC